MDGVEVEGRPRQLLMLKEWMELESSAEISRDGFGCYPRHLAAELRSASGRRGNGDAIARFSAAVRAALSRPPAGREREAAALSRSLSRRLRLRAGFWRKRRGDAEETDRPKVGGQLSAKRKVEHLLRMLARLCSNVGEAPSSSLRLSPPPLSLQSSSSSPSWLRKSITETGLSRCSRSSSKRHAVSHSNPSTSMMNHRASQQLRQRIRRFEQLAEIDASDADNATTTAEDTASCHLKEELDNSTDDGEGVHAQQDTLPSHPGSDLLCAAAAAPHCFKKLLQDFFREGLSSCQDGGISDDPELEGALLENAKAWLDGRHHALRRPDGRAAEVEEIERLGRWRWFREDERELLGSDVEGGLFWSLMEELVHDLC